MTPDPPTLLKTFKIEELVSFLVIGGIQDTTIVKVVSNDYYKFNQVYSGMPGMSAHNLDHPAVQVQDPTAQDKLEKLCGTILYIPHNESVSIKSQAIAACEKILENHIGTSIGSLL